MSSLAAGRIKTMNAKVHTGDGTFLIEEKDFNPVTVESLDAALDWDEAGRVMTLDRPGLSRRRQRRAPHRGVDGEPARMRRRPGPRRWRAATPPCAGRPPQDAPVKIDAMDAQLSGRDGGIAIDALTLSGAGRHGDDQRHDRHHRGRWRPHAPHRRPRRRGPDRAAPLAGAHRAAGPHLPGGPVAARPRRLRRHPGEDVRDGAGRRDPGRSGPGRRGPYRLPRLGRGPRRHAPTRRR